MILRGILTVHFVLVAGAGFGQYFQYSQYNFTSQRINPAMVGSTDYASLGMVYRNQATAGPTNLKSSFLSSSYPIMNRKTGKRWSGIGLTLMDDRAGGIFTTQEASLSYAIHVSLDRFKTLSLGFKTLYQQRKLNLDGLVTGSQYIPDRGFDESISSGENIQFLKSDFVTFSTGLYWQQNDRTGKRIAYWSVSLFDFNKPQDSFLDVKSELNSTFIGCAGVTLYQQQSLSLSPEILFTRSSSTHALNIGAITSYTLNSFPNQPGARLDFITKYVVSRSAILGLQWHRENFSIGCSYDFPLSKQNAANISSVEIGLELRKLVEVKSKKRSSVTKKTSPNQKIASDKSSTKNLVKKNEGVKSGKLSSDSVKVMQKQKPSLSQTLQAKQDSAIASAEAGKINHQPLTIEKVTLHFNFEFGSSDLDEESTKYLDDLSTALLENVNLKIALTGHTDNIGSHKFNQRLSIFRAAIIKEYLVGKGISQDRITAEGKGLTEPLNENKTEEERAKNRRVELVILYDY